MIYSISANDPNFRPITFEKGLNVILSDRAEGSSEGESRNGTGKTSTIEIIHFCLGSELKQNKGLGQEPLKDWTFHLEFDLAGKKVRASRNTEMANIIIYSGDIDILPFSPKVDEEHGYNYFELKDWREILGKLMFNLPINPIGKYNPSFRMLIAFFARKGKEAYSSKPFKTFPMQAAWQVQVGNSYLLGLSWEFAKDWVVLKNKEEMLSKLKKAADSGVFEDYLGTVGELEAKKTEIKEELERREVELNSFKVHPQYAEIEIEANDITKEIHSLSNFNLKDRRVVELYRTNLSKEQIGNREDIEKLYRQVGVIFPDSVISKLDDVIKFHNDVTENRSTYLESEIAKKVRNISEKELKIKELTEKRAGNLEVLKQHKALDEYNRLQERKLSSQQLLEGLDNKITMLKKFEQGKSSLRIEKEELKQKTRQDYDERNKIREHALKIFNESSKALYNSHGSLIIDVADGGYKFDTNIERAESAGIQLMEMYCYDMLLAQLWSQNSITPGFLVHDSTLFADVDERQVAKALMYAADSSKKHNFQYIVCLNSDSVPKQEFSDDFKFDELVRMELKDSPDNMCLFGKRF